jgi:hypothetical protein
MIEHTTSNTLRAFVAISIVNAALSARLARTLAATHRYQICWRTVNIALRIPGRGRDGRGRPGPVRVLRTLSDLDTVLRKRVSEGKARGENDRNRSVSDCGPSAASCLEGSPGHLRPLTHDDGGTFARKAVAMHNIDMDRGGAIDCNGGTGRL